MPTHPAICVLLLVAATAYCRDVFVAPEGNDDWSGVSAELAAPDGPKATLPAALEAAREAAGEPSRLILRGGDYWVTEPLVLEARDSGMIIEAAPGEEPRLIGGCEVTGWERAADGLWSAPVPEAYGQPLDFRMLVVNDRMCRRARLPEEGFFEHLSVFDVPWMSTTGGGWQRKPTEIELTTMRVKPEDIRPGPDPRNAEVTVYHMWDESMVGVASIDHDAGVVTFSTPTGHPPGAFGVKRYVVWNTREGLTRPGQWCLDRTAGKVLYRPLEGADMAQPRVLAPAVESIIILNGSAEAPVRDVVLRGLSLTVTNTPLEAGGFGAGRFRGAVEASHAHGCRLEGLTVANVGRQGIRAASSDGLRVERCAVGDTGACGIIVRGTDTAVTDSRVSHIGLTYPSAIGLWVGGSRAHVSHNEVAHTPYTGIAAGGDDHVIEANVMHHNMLELHDGAGIYTTFCRRVTLRGNLIRDIEETGGYGASAYYLDEQAEDCLVEDNVSVNVGRPSHNHMAESNTVRHNLFIVDGDATLTFPKSSGYRLEGNVITATGKIAFSNAEAIATADRNVFFSAAGQLENAPAGGSTDDPLVRPQGEGVFTFAPGSPAAALGIAPFDVSAAGPRD